jgi:hypothetical protein
MGLMAKIDTIRYDDRHGSQKWECTGDPAAGADCHAADSSSAADGRQPKAGGAQLPARFHGLGMGVDPGSGQIQVESQAEKIVRPVTVKLAKDTLVFRREAGVLKQIDVSEIHLQAELWLIGPVPNSFPAMVNVRQVIVDQLY